MANWGGEFLVSVFSLHSMQMCLVTLEILC